MSITNRTSSSERMRSPPPLAVGPTLCVDPRVTAGLVGNPCAIRHAIPTRSRRARAPRVPCDTTEYSLSVICLIGYAERVLAALDALAEPKRRQILDLLRSGEQPVGVLVDHLHVSQPAVSKHLRVLREAGLVDVRADAQRRLYRVRTEPLQALDAWLEPYRDMWKGSLDELEHHLDTMDHD